MLIGNKIINLDNKFFIEKQQEQKSSVIQTLCSNLKGYKNMDEAITILNNTQKQNNDIKYRQRDGAYIYQNYYIIPGIKPLDRSFESNIRFINKLGLCKTSAPELIEVSNSKDNSFCVIIYKLNDTKGGELLPIKTLSNIPRKSKKRFISEQIELLDNTGLYNSAVTDSYDYWLITPDTKNIVIDSWSDLKRCTDLKQKKDIEEQLQRVI